VLDLLADGAWHSHHEGYALGLILHSRVAELRKRGYRIEMRREGDLYLYRLAGDPSSSGFGFTPFTEGATRPRVSSPADSAVAYPPADLETVTTAAHGPGEAMAQLAFGEAAA
jgi:hypothetical protein